MLTEQQQSGSICLHIADRCNYTSKSTQGLPLHRDDRQKTLQKKQGARSGMQEKSHRTKQNCTLSTKVTAREKKKSKEQNSCKRKNLSCHRGLKSEVHHT